MSCRRLLLSLLLGMLLAAPPVRAAGTAGAAPTVTVLIYHHFGDDRYPTTDVPLDDFRAQMAYLLANHYRVIPLAELVRDLTAGTPLPDRAVVITIDDGYRSIYDRAWPILKSFGYPFTVFLYVEGLEKHYSNYLTWDQVKEMEGAGVDFEDHSYSHYYMADAPAGLDEAEYRQWLSADLVKSGRILLQRLGRRPPYLAIPYGEYSLELMEEAKKLGYEALLTQDPGCVGPETSPFMIPREPILGHDWSTIAQFEEILQRLDLPIHHLTPPYGRLTGNPPFFAARINHPERYRPDSYQVYVSQYGWLPAHLADGDLVKVANPGVLTRHLNRVMIRAREKTSGRTAQRTW